MPAFQPEKSFGGIWRDLSNGGRSFDGVFDPVKNDLPGSNQAPIGFYRFLDRFLDRFLYRFLDRFRCARRIRPRGQPSHPARIDEECDP